MKNCIIFDLDQTIADTSPLESLRKERNWAGIYKNLNLIKIYPEINTVIEILRSREFLIGVVTNSPKTYCVKVLDYLNIKVDCVVGYHCTTLKKPHADPILFCINQLGSDFNKIFGIGDGANDIISYKKSNIISIGCLWGRFNNDELIGSNPQFLINSPTDLINIIINKNNI